MSVTESTCGRYLKLTLPHHNERTTDLRGSAFSSVYGNSGALRANAEPEEKARNE